MPCRWVWADNPDPVWVWADNPDPVWVWTDNPDPVWVWADNPDPVWVWADPELVWDDFCCDRPDSSFKLKYTNTLLLRTLTLVVCFWSVKSTTSTAVGPGGKSMLSSPVSCNVSDLNSVNNNETYFDRLLAL